MAIHPLHLLGPLCVSPDAHPSVQISLCAASPARGGEPTWKRLYEKQPLWEQARAATRQQLADAEMAKCTFTPELATRSKSPQK